MTKIDMKSVEHATQTANADEFIIKLPEGYRTNMNLIKIKPIKKMKGIWFQASTDHDEFVYTNQRIINQCIFFFFKRASILIIEY